MASSRLFWRIPLLACGVIVLLCAMWGGLLRIGWIWPDIGTGAVLNHGALMVGGFLGTLISLERAVALGRAWTYVAPGAAAAGGICLLLRLPPWIGQTLLLIASAVLVLIFIWLVIRQSTLFMVTMGLGAIAWCVGNALWLYGWPIPWLVSWWVGFLVLTIVGERLELSRFIAPLPGRHALFIGAIGIYAVGVVLSVRWMGLGWVVSGAGLLAIVAWLLIHDLARRTIRANGLPRFAAACLLSGYFWMAVGGALMIGEVLVRPLLQGAGSAWVSSAPMTGMAYDAMLHAVLVGFVFAMIFGHAPIIFPAVLGIPMRYHPRFYAHLALLEIAMVLRIGADLGDWWTVRQWAGLLTAIAIIGFLMQTISSIDRHAAPPPQPAQPKKSGRSISLGAIAVEQSPTAGPTG